MMKRMMITVDWVGTKIKNDNIPYCENDRWQILNMVLTTRMIDECFTLL